MTPTRRIALILTIVFLIPALFFSVYEMSTLSRDEEMIEAIYQKQLEAILFSVNQYSDDAVNSWMLKFESRLSGEYKPEPWQEFLTINSTILTFFSIDTAHWKPVIKFHSLDSLVSLKISTPLQGLLSQNQNAIDRLLKYQRSGFQKLEALNDSLRLLGRLKTLVFISKSRTPNGNVQGFVLDPELFVENIIGPRLQGIAQEQFVISIWNRSSNTRLYSTMVNDSTMLQDQPLTKSFWNFPDYELGIRVQGESIEDLARERTNTNLWLLAVLDIVLVAALIMVFRNVKKEVQLAQNKADFVSNVSHEIRTPLSLISMFAETLEMGRAKSDEKKQEYYSIISKETQRLSGIVNKILSFSQMEAGKKTLRQEKIELNSLIKDVLRTYDFHLTSKGFEYELKESKLVQVRADKEAVVEVIINLIDNAIKYSADTKRLELKVGEDNGFGWLAVRDYGIGIRTSDQKHIFDKFYRVSSGNLAKSRGTGLGLSLVKQLTEQLHGRISVTSELGKGSTFLVSFPVAR